MKEITIDKLCNDADLIIEGIVTGIDTFPDRNKNLPKKRFLKEGEFWYKNSPWQEITILIKEVLKGKQKKNDKIIVVTQGGSVDGEIAEWVEDEAEFNLIGEKVILFLKKINIQDSTKVYYEIVGRFQGKRTIGYVLALKALPKPEKDIGKLRKEIRSFIITLDDIDKILKSKQKSWELHIRMAEIGQKQWQKEISIEMENKKTVLTQIDEDDENIQRKANTKEFIEFVKILKDSGYPFLQHHLYIEELERIIRGKYSQHVPIVYELEFIIGEKKQVSRFADGILLPDEMKKIYSSIIKLNGGFLQPKPGRR